VSLDGDEFLEAPGGKGANAAVAAARLGARTALVGLVGNDARARALLAHLTNEGVHSDHVSLDAVAPTGAAVIQVDEGGQKQILAALAANLRLTRTDVEAAADTIWAARILVAQLEVVVLEIGTRRVRHWNVTEHATADWTAQQFRNISTGDQFHRFVMHDRDAVFIAPWTTCCGP
jgi:ribokinase